MLPEIAEPNDGSLPLVLNSRAKPASLERMETLKRAFGLDGYARIPRGDAEDSEDAAAAAAAAEDSGRAGGDGIKPVTSLRWLCAAENKGEFEGNAAMAAKRLDDGVYSGDDVAEKVKTRTHVVVTPLMMAAGHGNLPMVETLLAWMENSDWSGKQKAEYVRMDAAQSLSGAKRETTALTLARSRLRKCVADCESERQIVRLLLLFDWQDLKARAEAKIGAKTVSEADRLRDQYMQRVQRATQGLKS